MPVGVVVMGVVFGSFYALGAIGLVLIFRSAGVVNFAHVATGAAPAIVAIQMRVVWHAPLPIVLVIGIALGAVVGALVEIGVMRRLRNAPASIQLVVTVALAEVLTGVGLVIPQIWRATSKSLNSFAPRPPPWFSLDPFPFNAYHVASVASVGCVVAVLGYLLRRTDIGVAARAAFDNPTRAALSGVPVARLSTATWAVAGALSAFAVLLKVLVTASGDFGGISAAGPGLMLRLLAPAAIAGWTSMPVAALASLCIGILEQAGLWVFSNGTLMEVVLALVIIVALAFRPMPPMARPGVPDAWWVSDGQARPVDDHARRPGTSRRVRIAVGVAAVALAGSVPLVLPGSAQQIATLTCIYSILGLSLVVVSGWAGHISLGQFSFAGIGGAVSGVLTGQHGWDLFLAFAIGMLAGGTAAVVVAIPALHRKSMAFPVASLAFAIATGVFLLDEHYVPLFASGPVPRADLWGLVSLDSDTNLYIFCLAVLVVVGLALRNFRASWAGRALIACRDNEVAAESVGLRPAHLRLQAVFISGAVAGLAGALYVVHQGGLYTESFRPEVSLRVLLGVVIGGISSLAGAPIGALYLTAAAGLFPPGWALVFSGAGVVLLLMYLPTGIAPAVHRARPAQEVAANVAVASAGDAAGGQSVGLKNQDNRNA